MMRTFQNKSVFCSIIVTTYLFGSLSTAPTNEGTDDYDESEVFTYPPGTDIEATTPSSGQDDSGDPWPTPSFLEVATTTTPPTHLHHDSSCETMQDELNEDMSIALKQDIADLLGTYNDWGKLLAPVPVTIGILGQLIVMANQLKDFPINSEDPEKTFKHVKYPSSLQTTLLQISQSGYKAFLKAHTNMDTIRLHNGAMPSDIKDAFRYIMSNNSRIIELRLPPVMAKIVEVAQKSQNLSKEVVDEFNSVLDLIVETQAAVNLTRIGVERRLEYALFDIKLDHESKIFSEMESLILQKKDTRMKDLLKRLELRKGKIDHTAIYNGAMFTINLSNDWVAEMGQERYKKDDVLLRNNTTNRWIHIYYENFIDSNPCAQKNSQTLLDLIILFEEYRQSYEHWQTIQKNNKSPFNGLLIISSIEYALGKLERCPDIENIIIRGTDLMKKLKSPNIFEPFTKTSKRPGEAEIKDIVWLAKQLRKSAMNVHEIEIKKRKIVTKSGWNILNASKKHQLNQITNMSKTIEEILKLNNELMEIRKEKTQHILNRISNLDITKGNTEYVIRVLKESLFELVKLKQNWELLVQFFDQVRNFILNASRHIKGLISILNHLSSEKLQPHIFYQDLMDNIGKSKEAARLVHGIADMYVNVSTLYIMDRAARLNTMNSLGIFGATNEQLIEEKAILTKDALEDTKGIEDYIRQHEKQLIDTLNKKHARIFKEYQQLTKCLEKDRLAIDNVSVDATKWFQLRSRFNGKMLVVSSYPQHTAPVEMSDTFFSGDYNQLWYLDEHEVIHSVPTGFCLTVVGGHSSSVTVERCDKTKTKEWKILDDQIVNFENQKKLCLGIPPENSESGVGLVDCQHRGKNPLWNVVKYKPTQLTTTSTASLDLKKEPTESEDYNSEYYDYT